MSDERIYLRDLRPEGCVKGTKAFLQRHGFDWNDFRKNGVSADEIEATGDAVAQIFVDKVRGRK